MTIALRAGILRHEDGVFTPSSAQHDGHGMAVGCITRSRPALMWVNAISGKDAHDLPGSRYPSVFDASRTTVKIVGQM